MITLMGLIVFLVHGTWAKGALWIDPEGSLGSAISEAIPGALIKPFNWSGRNTLHARNRAAEALAAELEKFKRSDDRIVVVAHSHGGNVAVRAVRLAQMHSRVELITLSTPFLLLRPRKLFRDGDLVVFSSFALIVQAALYSLIFGHGWTFFLLAEAAAVAVTILLFVMRDRGGVDAEAILRDQNYSGLRLHVLRSYGDEAGYALSLPQGLSAVITKFFLLVQKFQPDLEAYPAPVMARVLPLIGIAGALTLYFYKGWWHKGLLFAVVFVLLGWIIVGFASIILTFGLLIVWIGFFISIFLLWMLLLPLVLLACAVSSLAASFSARDMLASFEYDMISEATPPGEWRVRLFSADLDEKRSHSRLYEDPEAVVHMVNLIKQSSL
jgi:hypothetical protein